MILNDISRLEYEKGNPVGRAITHDHAKRFSIVKLPKSIQPITICWRSDTVEPTVFDDSITEVVWLGIDERLVCLSYLGNTLFSVALSSLLLQIIPFEGGILGLCQNEIIAINSDYSIRSIIGFPEIADSVVVKGDNLNVTFIDGDEQTFRC